MDPDRSMDEARDEAQLVVADEVRAVLGPLFVGLLVLVAAPSTAPFAALDHDGRLLHVASTASAVAAVALCAATLAFGCARPVAGRRTLLLELLAFDLTALAAAFGATALVGARFGRGTGAAVGVATVAIAAVAEITSLPSTDRSMVDRPAEGGSSTA
jgi:hypothetical protein